MTQTRTLPPRSAVPPENTWNSTSVFASDEAWGVELKAVATQMTALSAFQGRLGEGASTLAEAARTMMEFYRRVAKLMFYARMSQAVETTNAAAISMVGQASSLMARYGAAAAYFEPELLAVGENTVMQWAEQEPRLGEYRHYFSNLFRKQQHVREAAIEELLGMAQDPFSAIDNTEEMLTSADMKFQAATNSAGETLEVAQGTIHSFLTSPDREARRTAWENYADGYLALKNTLTSNYVASVKRDVFLVRARRFNTALEAVLFADNIASDVFHNLIDTYRKNLPTWHRYWEIRRRALGVETLHPYDIWAPIAKTQPQVPYRQAVDWICEGMKPLGEDYVSTLRKGCLEERWVDIYPNQGKTAGAFSYGTYDTYPFILMSYDDTLGAMSTLAHELGHSMHSYHSRKNQPAIYAEYSLFAAEVASNFNQAMTRAYLFEQNPDRDFQIAVIEEAMSNIHRYFFIMPTLARFELEVHTRIEEGKGITADDTIDLMVDLFSEGYGSAMHIDRERVGITWAQFGHLYANYYVFQYATGISAAHALAGRILAGEARAVDDYLTFLSAGGSVYPVDALKGAGADMSTPEPVEKAFAILASYVDRLDQLTRS